MANYSDTTRRQAWRSHSEQAVLDHMFNSVTQKTVKKPKRSSVPRAYDAEQVDLELALKLLSLPREVGQHPETGNVITAGLGRFGPFVLHDGTYANLESVEDVFTIGINHAVTLIAEKLAGGKGRFQRTKAKVLKDLGEHPDGGKMEVLDGRYGPYVKYGKINATVPKGKEPTELTAEEAIQLIAERAAKAPAKKKRAASKSKAKSSEATEKKTTKSTAKKTAKKKTAKKTTRKTSSKKVADKASAGSKEEEAAE